VGSSPGGTTTDPQAVWADLYRLTGDVVELLWPFGSSGITFQHSKTWSISAWALAESDGRSVIRFELNTFGGLYRGGFPVVPGSAIRIERSPAEDLQSFIDRQRMDRQIVQRAYCKIAGEKATSVTYRDVHEEFTETEDEVYFLHGSSLYVFTLDPAGPESRGALVEIVKSLRFTE